MKKLMAFFLLILFCFPIVVYADGYQQDSLNSPIENGASTPLEQDLGESESGNSNSSTDNLLEDGNERIRQYRSRIERQEVKGGNERQGSVLPLILTIVVASCGCGGYYYFKKIKANY